jgi:hypothetical protein
VGVVAGLAYLAKAFVLPLFLVHFALVIGWQLHRRAGERRAWLARYGVASTSFALVSAPWIAALSLKYGHVTYSTAPQYNWRIMGPAHNGLHPTYAQGLLDPSGPHSITAWQDPTLLKLQDWSLFESPGHFARLLMENSISIVGVLERATVLAGAIALVALLIALGGRVSWGAAERRPLVLLSALGVLLIAGYVVTKVQPQYMWLPVLLLLLLGAAAVSRIYETTFFTRKVTLILAGIMLTSFALPAVRNLYGERNAGHATWVTAQELRRAPEPIDGHSAASNTSFRETLYLSYYRNARYYGLVPSAPDEARRQLRAKKIEYFFYWGDPTDQPPYLAHATLVFEEPDRELRVFRLN